MEKVINFAKKEAVLVIATILAMISMFIVPPDTQYKTYISYDVILVLFCLMAVVAGFIKSGFFDYMSQTLLSKTKNKRTISLALTMLCFFTSMILTNDVALLTFVPLTIAIFAGASQNRLIFVIVMETIDANLGSMLTPIGNPQNLYIYSYFNMSIGEFVKIVLPICAFSFLLIVGITFLSKGGKLKSEIKENQIDLDKKKILIYTLLFIPSILTVVHLLDYRICFGITVAMLIIFDKTIFTKIDYALLITFIAFFIFVGNLGRMDIIKTTLLELIQGKELIVSVMASQVISNVPAAIMLSNFTDNVKELLLGVNIGGLGTLIASLASLISYKLYARSQGAKPMKFIIVFTALNLSILVALIGFVTIS